MIHPWVAIVNEDTKGDGERIVKEAEAIIAKNTRPARNVVKELNRAMAVRVREILSANETSPARNVVEEILQDVLNDVSVRVMEIPNANDTSPARNVVQDILEDILNDVSGVKDTT